MASYTYRVTLTSHTPTRQTTQSHDYPFLSSAHHAAVQYVSKHGTARYGHAKTATGIRYSAQDQTRHADIAWQRG